MTKALSVILKPVDIQPLGSHSADKAPGPARSLLHPYEVVGASAGHYSTAPVPSGTNLPICCFAVWTSDLKGAGTDANVYIKITDSADHTIGKRTALPPRGTARMPTRLDLCC